MSATSLRAALFLLAPAEVGERMAGGWGRAAQRLRSSRATPSKTWSLKAWIDLSSDDSAGGVEGGDGGQRITFQRPHS